ncbi:hypothetical protein ACFL59_09525 [Planctomycetota bacterium]
MTEPTLTDKMERLIATHEDLAKLVLTVLEDDSLSREARAPLGVGARYAVEHNDLIPNSLEDYGLIDDLFILGIAVNRFLDSPHASVRAYADKAVSGRPVADYLKEMQSEFGSFWEYCEEASAAFFEHVCDKMEYEKGYLAKVRDNFREEIKPIGESTRNVKLQEANLRWFLLKYKKADPGASG